jgi:hypothetical protein
VALGVELGVVQVQVVVVVEAVVVETAADQELDQLQAQ